ncbi:Ankyrin repeat-containing protein [Cladophialophora immunda]|nr:Ankyrin repeat-containing protein [Cladophialophora immunda]
MRKFIKEIKGKRPRSADARRQTGAPDAGQPSTVEQERLLPELQALADESRRYGLKPLPSLPGTPTSEHSYDLSVVAVHGLGGDFYRTWASRDSQKQTLWLSQLLPEDLPGARIYSFGYDSAPTFSRSVTGIRDAANDLLQSLMSLTKKWPAKPIIFICHSLGGIVVKQAMIMAHEFDYFADVLRATRLIVFMGTPHRGSQIAATLAPLATFTNFWLDISYASAFAGSMRTDLIMKPPGCSSLVVEQQSAVLGLPEEIEISIQADHMAMCRFSSRSDHGYEPLTQAIVHAVKQMMPDTSHRSFTESESRYVATFSRRSDVPIDEPLQGTCVWSTSTREYRDWRAERRPAVLWLIGDAGCGKTVLTNFLVRELRDNVAPPSTEDELVCCFFCARDIESQKDARSLLRALILQILSVKKDIIRQIKAAYSLIRHEYEPSFETLWHIFEMAVGLASCSCLYIVIDALDECEEKSRSLFLAKVLHMVRPRSLDGETQRKRIKLIISGQPLISRAWRIGDESLSQFYIDMEERPEGLVGDLQRFIDYKVEDLVYNAICSEAFGEQLKRKLYNLAENSFLWLSVVLEDLKQGLNYRDADVQRVLTTIPGNLKDSYTKHLPPVSKSQLPRLKCYLQLLVACARPFTLSEVDVFTTLYDRQSAECISPVDGALVLNSLRRALGPLVKFPDGKVQFIHSTVKGYLLALQSEPDHLLHKTHGVDLDTAHLLLAKACIRSLLQEADSPDAPDEERLSSEMPSPSPISARSSKGEATRTHLMLNYSAFMMSPFCETKAPFQRTSYHTLAVATRATIMLHDAIKLLSCGSPRLSRWYKYKANHSPTAMPDQSEVNALVLAALFDYPTVLQRLLSNRGLTDESTQLQSALYWASSRGHLKSINVLLEHKSPLLDAGRDRSALAVAIQGGFTEACEVLLGADDADPNYSGLRTPPPLVLAAAHDHVEILVGLLRHGSIDVNQTNLSGHTALIQACRSGSDQCLKELLGDDRTNINSCDSDGRNALIHACMSSNALAVEQLLRKPLADVCLCDKYGRNAMSYAAEKATLPIVRRLFHLQVPIAKEDASGRNAISWAANSSRATKHSDHYGQCVLEYLIEKSPEEAADSQDKDGWSPLAWALDRPGYLEAVRILIEKGKADVNQRNQAGGRSVLAWAASEGFTQIVEYLLGLPHLDKNATGDDGRSPLSHAAANGRVRIVELLLGDSEVRADLRDSKGRAPIDWARMNHHDAIVSLLSEHGLE